MKQKLIYIASPFSNKDKGIEFLRYLDATIISAKLTKKYGYAMFLPITQSYQLQQAVPSLEGSFERWADIDLFLIEAKCDEVWVIMLDGWKESTGVQAEIQCADKNNKPVYYIDPITLKRTKKV